MTTTGVKGEMVPLESLDRRDYASIGPGAAEPARDLPDAPVMPSEVTIQAHGLEYRPSGDVDLFLNWQRREDFGEAVDAVMGALEAAAMEVRVVARAETFARLLVTDPASAGGEPEKVEVAADWRSREAVTLEIGPVLHADDAVANKMSALYGAGH